MRLLVFIAAASAPVARADTGPLQGPAQSNLTEAYLEPATLNITAEDVHRLMVTAGFAKVPYFRLLQQRYSGWTSVPSAGVSLRNLAAMRAAPRSVVFIGDSVVREISQRFARLTQQEHHTLTVHCFNWSVPNCVNHTIPQPTEDQCRGVVFITVAVLSSFNFWSQVLRPVVTACKAEVAWLGEGLHLLLRPWVTSELGRGLVGPGFSLLHTSIALERKRYFATVLLRARQEAVELGIQIITNAMFTADEAILLADPPKHDFARFFDFSVARMWAAVDAGIAAQHQTAPELVVANIAELPARYPGMRCDGMHYYSYIKRPAGALGLRESWGSWQESNDTTVCAPSASLWDDWLVHFWRTKPRHVYRPGRTQAAFRSGRPSPLR